MTKFKHLCALRASVVLFTLAFALFAVSSQAQQYNTWATNMTRFNGGTNTVALNSTSAVFTTQGVIDAKFSEYVALGFYYNFLIAPVGGTPTVIARFQRSVDNVNWESATNMVVLTMSGLTNGNTWVTNINMGSFRGLRLSTIENTNSTALTNVTLYYAIKR